MGGNNTQEPLGGGTSGGVDPVGLKNVAQTPINPATEEGIGALTETAPATDTASSGLNGRLQRIAQRITSLITSITDGSQRAVIVDTAGKDLDFRAENENWNAADHGILVFGRDTVSTPNKYRALKVDTDGELTSHLANAAHQTINPAQNEGQVLLKKTVALAASGTVHSTTAAKKLRIYNMKFSLSADMTDVAFKWNGGSAFEKYLNPKSGGLYGTNLHPNCLEGALSTNLLCDITGSGTVQINLEYIEI